MIRDALRRFVYAAAPAPLVQRHIHRRLLKKGRELIEADRSSTQPEDSLTLVWESYDFRPLQIFSEIRELLRRIGVEQPRTIVEIGSAGGGTTFLFSRAAGPSATIISIDLGFSDARMQAIEAFARPDQKIRCLRADSQRQETADHVRELSGAGIDLLFIDGDHSYSGVSADFRFYSPLVIPGGLIVFHDIVPDFRQRFGKETVVETGDVPRFWSELKTSFGDSMDEIVQEPDQDGYGLGVVRWHGAGA